MACLTAQNFIGPSFGLPFVTGSLPHSPQMVKALTNYKQEPDGSFSATGVAENRIAPFIMCARKRRTCLYLRLKSLRLLIALVWDDADYRLICWLTGWLADYLQVLSYRTARPDPTSA